MKALLVAALSAALSPVGAAAQEPTPPGSAAESPEARMAREQAEESRRVRAMTVEELEALGPIAGPVAMRWRIDLPARERVRIVALQLRLELDHPCPAVRAFNDGVVDSTWHQLNWLVACEQLPDLGHAVEWAVERGELEIPEAWFVALLAHFDRTDQWPARAIECFHESSWSGALGLQLGLLREIGHHANVLREHGGRWAPLELRAVVRRASLHRTRVGHGGCCGPRKPETLFSREVGTIARPLDLKVDCDEEGRITVDFDRDAPLASLWTPQRAVGETGGLVVDPNDFRRAVRTIATQRCWRQLQALVAPTELLPASRWYWDALDGLFRTDPDAVGARLRDGDRESVLWLLEEVAQREDPRWLELAKSARALVADRFLDHLELASAALLAHARSAGTIDDEEKRTLERLGFLPEPPPPDAPPGLGDGPPAPERNGSKRP